MSVYCISDIHGQYELFEQMLKKINFNNNDILYILGDIIDKGPDVYEIYHYIITHDNVIPLKGNHEYMAEQAIKYNYNRSMWIYYNFGIDTLKSFKNHLIQFQYEFEDEKGKEILKECGQIPFNAYCVEQKILSYCENLPYYIQIELNGYKFLLVHAGFLGNRSLSEQTEENMVWIREAFFNNPFKVLSEDKSEVLDNDYVIFGHTPILTFTNYQSADVWFDKKYKDKICLDGGCFAEQGQLNCLRLDDFKCYSLSKKNYKEYYLDIKSS